MVLPSGEYRTMKKNLWDANYARKHAYKGVADGLAGKDVSGDFTGDLE